MRLKYKRFPDHCYAVIRGNRRGPAAPNKVLARARYLLSGLIAFAGSDRDARKQHGQQLAKGANRAAAV